MTPRRRAKIDQLVVRCKYCRTPAVARIDFPAISVRSPKFSLHAQYKLPLGDWFIRLHAGGGVTTTAFSCVAAGVPYRFGCGFYSVAKAEKVSAAKDIIAVNEATGEQVVRAAAVRAKLGLMAGDITISPSSLLRVGLCLSSQRRRTATSWEEALSFLLSLWPPKPRCPGTSPQRHRHRHRHRRSHTRRTLRRRQLRLKLWPRLRRRRRRLPPPVATKARGKRHTAASADPPSKVAKPLLLVVASPSSSSSSSSSSSLSSSSISSDFVVLRRHRRRRTPLLLVSGAPRARRVRLRLGATTSLDLTWT